MRKKLIVCVDDNPGVLGAMRRLLERNGYEVATFDNGRNALAAQETRAADLIMLDIMMPGMDGYELLDELRRNLCATPVVMLTGKDKDSEVLRGYMQGAVYYITKPFKNEHVLNIVEYLVGDLSEAERAKLELKL